MGYSNQFPFIPFIISDEVIVLGIEYSLGLFLSKLYFVLVS